MAAAFWTCVAAFTLIYMWLYRDRVAVEELQDERAAQIDAEEVPA